MECSISCDGQEHLKNVCCVQKYPLEKGHKSIVVKVSVGNKSICLSLPHSQTIKSWTVNCVFIIIRRHKRWRQPLKWLKSKSTCDQVGGRDTCISHGLLSEQTQIVIPVEQKMTKILWETYIYQVGQDNMLYGPIHSMYLHSLNIESKLEYGQHQTLWCSQKFEYWGKGRKFKQCIAMSVFWEDWTVWQRSWTVPDFLAAEIV